MSRVRMRSWAEAPHGSFVLAERIGRIAVCSLYHEAALHPKPGLVSPIDSGSHRDMSMTTFYRSLLALRRYFPASARAGAADANLSELQALGIRAERAMLQATNGINTHRGAIFNLGLLCASAGQLVSTGTGLTPRAVCRGVAERWGAAIRQSARTVQIESHGLEMSRRYGVGGARAQAADGFPSVIDASLPAYTAVLAATADSRRAAVQALFVLIERLDDSNLLWRGGPEGSRFARECAGEFLRRGGALAADWLHCACEFHRGFVARNLSPGGSADLLAVTLFLHSLETHARPLS
jgi:triphosphoribosyl-dephospho-CoA synthase